MPTREEERGRWTEEDLRYCVFCRRYLSPIAWASHPHNPDRKGQSKFKRTLSKPLRKLLGRGGGSR